MARRRRDRGPLIDAALGEARSHGKRRRVRWQGHAPLPAIEEGGRLRNSAPVVVAVIHAVAMSSRSRIDPVPNGCRFFEWRKIHVHPELGRHVDRA